MDEDVMQGILRHSMIKRMFRWMSFALPFVAVVGCTTRPRFVPAEPLAGPVTIELHVEGGMSYADALVDGKSLRLMIDLGSGEAVSLFEGRLENTGARPTGRSRKIQNAFGQVFDAREFVVSELKLGDWQALDVPGSEGFAPGFMSSGGDSAFDPPGDGHLGTGLFAAYDVLLDTPGRQLTLYPPQAAAPARIHDWPSTVCTRPEEGLVIEGRVNGQRLKLLLDSGASSSILHPKAASALGLQPPGDVPLVRIEVLELGTLGTFALDFYVIPYRHPRVDALLGANFFAQFPLFIDFDEGRIAVGPRARED